MTLASMVTGLLLSRCVQFREFAVWVPADIQLLSAVRRFERFVYSSSIDSRLGLRVRFPQMLHHP
jgi:hypothetical protein